MHVFTAALAAAPTTAPTQDAPWWANSSALFIIPIGILMMVMLSGNKSKKVEAKQRQEMLANLKRGDRVQTIGGILGTVVDARDTEVTLKVDEGSNTKMRFTRDSVKRVVTEEEAVSTK